MVRRFVALTTDYCPLVTDLIWHLITPEYPPQPGGVSDYTRRVAAGLAAAGDDVHVWCPEEQGEGGRGKGAEVGGQRSEVGGQVAEGGDQGEGARGKGSVTGSLAVHRELGRFTRSDLRVVDRKLDQFKAPRRLLVQWVPHGYGYRSMNLHFCFWLWRRARHGDAVEIVAHEPFLSFREGSWKQKGVAVVHRLMTMILLRAARRVWMTIPAWEAFWRPYALGRSLKFNWLPVASNIPVIEDPDSVRAIRARYTSSAAALVGHFGTYDRNITKLLLKSVPALMQNGKPQGMLLIGRGSDAMRDELIRKQPALADRVHATGTLAANELSLHVSACDVMLQPYVDGVSSRRTSTMVALAHGVPVVTTEGMLTESLWAESKAVALVPATDMLALAAATQRLLPDAASRKRLSAAASKLYYERFDLKRTIATLREADNEAQIELDSIDRSDAARPPGKYELDRTQFPEYARFVQSCRRGLATVYPLKPGTPNDLYGWKFGTGWPPSYWAFGRMRSLLAVHNALLLKPHRALEVAAGGGGLASCLAASGCEVLVNDLRAEELATSLKDFRNAEGIRIEAGNLFSLSPERIGKFDLVLACEVIEHVAHPLELLRHLKNFLEPNGRLVLTTPNGSYFRNKLPTYAEVQDFGALEKRQFMPDADGHLFLLTPGELCEIAAAAGLAVERLSVWGTPMLTGHAGFRFFAGRFLVKVAYWTELLTQHLPTRARASSCAALSATLRPL